MELIQIYEEHKISVLRIKYLRSLSVKKEVLSMERKKVSKAVAGVVVHTLNAMLHVDANSTSCMVVYQPKAPKELARYRRKK